MCHYAQRWKANYQQADRIVNVSSMQSVIQQTIAEPLRLFGGCSLYVDVNNVCDVGCTHCMYRDVHGSEVLQLSDKRLQTFQCLTAKSNHITLSGEGEPLRSIGVIFALLNACATNSHITLITSGDASWETVASLLKEAQRIASARLLTVNFRVSVDRWHFAKVKNNNYLNILNWFENNQSPHLLLSFRGVLSDRANLGKIFSRQILALKSPCVFVTDELNDKLSFGTLSIPIMYRQHVWPEHTSVPTGNGVSDYICAYERVNARAFRLGSYDLSRNRQGINVTVKPNGNVYLYGAEPLAQWHLDDSSLDIHRIEELVSSKPEINLLYKLPFRMILASLETNDAYRNAILRAGNPYWVMKAVHQADEHAYGSILQRLAIPPLGF